MAVFSFGRPKQHIPVGGIECHRNYSTTTPGIFLVHAQPALDWSPLSKSESARNEKADSRFIIIWLVTKPASLQLTSNSKPEYVCYSKEITFTAFDNGLDEKPLLWKSRYADINRLATSLLLMGWSPNQVHRDPRCRCNQIECCRRP